MVKRQKEKQYQSTRELRASVKSDARGRERKLPFHCCALTLSSFQHPVCNASGIVFENTAIVPFLLKHKVDPVTGQTMSSNDLIKLNMEKDEEGRWECPVLNKPFSDHTKIVAIRNGSEASVYSWQAYKELNLKAKNMYDLILGHKFTKKDVIVLNDPDDEELNNKRDINNFHHVRNSRLIEAGNPNANVQRSVTAMRVMEKLSAKKRTIETTSTADSEKKKSKTGIITSEMVTGIQLTSGKTSGSLTSSSMAVSNTNESRAATREEILQAQFSVMRHRKRKGYVTLHTNIGDIGLELHCEVAPRTCTNFFGLAEGGKYDGSSFHRLIPSFMIQGGKGEPDSSFWGEPFVDEFDDRLKHDAEGILSMANAGPKTNKRQFFLTFGPAPHLDRKHSVFGKIVDGIEVLREMKKIPTDKKDRPIHEVTITKVSVLVNPAKEAEELEKTRLEKLIFQDGAKKKEKNTAALGRKQPVQPAKNVLSQNSSSSMIPVVGKYLPKSVQKSEKQERDGWTSKASRLPPPPKKTQFGDFSGW